MAKMIKENKSMHWNHVYRDHTPLSCQIFAACCVVCKAVSMDRAIVCPLISKSIQWLKNYVPALQRLIQAPSSGVPSFPIRIWASPVNIDPTVRIELPVKIWPRPGSQRQTSFLVSVSSSHGPFAEFSTRLPPCISLTSCFPLLP